MWTDTLDKTQICSLLQDFSKMLARKGERGWWLHCMRRQYWVKDAKPFIKAKSRWWFAERKTGQQGNIWRSSARSIVSHDVELGECPKNLRHYLSPVLPVRCGIGNRSVFLSAQRSLHIFIPSAAKKTRMHRNHTSILALGLEMPISVSLNGIQAHRFCERPWEDSIVCVIKHILPLSNTLITFDKVRWACLRHLTG